MIGGGAGNAPSTTTTGTGVLTALGNTAGGASGFALLNSSGYLTVSQGGTGQSSALTQYGVVYGSATTAMSTTAAGTTGQVLLATTSAAPSWGQVSLTAGVTGVLPIANGGTNSTATPTAGGVGYGTGTAHAYSAAGTSGYALTSGGSGAPTWTALVNQSSTGPTQTIYLTGSGTYTVPTGVKWIRVRMVGAGSGGSGGGNGGAGGAGGNTTFGTSLYTANGGGAGGGGIAPSAGGAASGANINISGGSGSGGAYHPSAPYIPGGTGGASAFGGGGEAGYVSAGQAGFAYGSGGGGGALTSSATSGYTGGAGAAGGYCESIIVNPSATYSYAVGAGGTAGTAGTNGYAGGAGAGGIIIIEEHYNY